MSQHMFTFSVGSQSMNSMLITPAAQNSDATDWQHTGTLCILWLSMKMNVSTALKLILSNTVNPCLTMSPWIQGTHSSFKWLKKWKSTSKHQFLWTSTTHLGTHHVLTHCCIPVVHGQFWAQFSQVTPVQWINLELCLVGFPKPVPPLVLCSNFLDVLGWEVQSPWWMPTHFWTSCNLSISDAVSVHHHHTPALTGSEYQGWKFFAYINHTTPHNYLHDRVCTIITNAHKIIP